MRPWRIISVFVGQKRALLVNRHIKGPVRGPTRLFGHVKPWSISLYYLSTLPEHSVCLAKAMLVEERSE